MAEAAPSSNPVARQYEKWVYPLPVMDLAAKEEHGKRDGGDFGRNFHTFWPDRAPREDLDVLIAGCGSNAAARYAFNHPQARVTGIDLSGASLAHENFLKEKHNLSNLTLHQGRLEEVAGLGRDFDFIDASGVLHHLPDPVAGLKALGGVLRAEGTIALMIYGRHGRAGVYMAQEMFRLMGLEQDEAGLAMVKETLAALPKNHALRDYIRRPKDVTYDAGLVDTFLHRQDRAYTVAECLGFADAAGLRFMHWWDNILYYPEGQLKMDQPLYKKLAAMPERAVWEFMELYNGTLAQHAFCLCHPGRAESGYRIDFSGDTFMNYIPVRRCAEVASKEGVPEGCIAVRRDTFPAYTLGPAATALFRQIDGKKSVRDCGTAAGMNGADMTAACRGVFRYLWRLSYIFLRIPG